MEAVAAHLVLFIVFIGQSIGIGDRGHRLVEGGIEHGDHRHAGHELLAGLDANDVGGIVQRGKGIAVLNRLHDLVGDDDGLGEFLPAVDDAVANGVDLLHRADHAVLFIDQRIKNGLDGLAVGRHGDGGFLYRFLAGQLRLVGKAAVDANAFAKALGKQLARGGVEQLILQRGRTRIDDQNVHKYTPFSRGGLHCARISDRMKKNHRRAEFNTASIIANIFPNTSKFNKT